MAAIFTATVIMRSKKGGSPLQTCLCMKLIEAERVCNEEFLCAENLAEKKDLLADCGGENGCS